MTNTPICGIHNKQMTLRNGQYGDFWSCSTKNPDGSWCKFKPGQSAPSTPNEQKFIQQLNNADHQEVKMKKDRIISRLAIAKSLIESGREFNNETKFQAENWLAWVEERKLLDNAPSATNCEDMGL